MLEIHPDICEARTPPTEFYTDSAIFAALKERVLARCWHLIGDLIPDPEPTAATAGSDLLKRASGVFQQNAGVFAGGAATKEKTTHLRPFTLLPGCLDEPLLIVQDEEMRCMSNVCTHRGTILVEEAAPAGTNLRCRYHGRQFGLDGGFKHMPEFEGCRHFPSETDNLSKVPLRNWRGLTFVSLKPAHDLAQLTAAMDARVGFLPIEKFKLDRARSREYVVKAHFALYCDNYLEGFHVPFVHASLAQTLEYGAYTTELFELSNLQLGIARPGEPCFDLPVGHPDHGKRVAGYYFWLFPCTMLNFYPWGLSVNAVRPVTPELTRVQFLSYVWDESKLDKGAGADLHRVEMEDEAVVEAVQRGLKGRFYTRGRYSPTRETGTHHFHRLLSSMLH
ncbi:MAG: Rieske 2Fe-2S domain-containing protein [Planctomycetes bacterium]|nr:Rieske 2Fe-2S domain-containing protein [Planctomycetota bacterium]